MRSWFALVMTGAFALKPSLASCEEDGVYGRLAGELDWSFKLGAASHPAGFSPSAGMSLHYYSLFGVTADVAPIAADESRPEHTQVALGAELRPLFLPRWLMGWQSNSASWDLTIDSLAVGVGNYVNIPSSDPASVGLWLTLGMGVPLLGSSSGPWLELKGFRRVPDPAADRAPSHGGFLVYFSYHQFAQLAR